MSNIPSEGHWAQKRDQQELNVDGLPAGTFTYDGLAGYSSQSGEDPFDDVLVDALSVERKARRILQRTVAFSPSNSSTENE